jgi:transposase-like protein
MQKPRTREERMAIIADWRASGLPRATYARQHGLSEPTLRMWTRRLKDELNDSLLSAAPPRIEPAFIELALPSLVAAAPASIEVTLAGATVRVPAGVDADTLARVFAALRGAA